MVAMGPWWLRWGCGGCNGAMVVAMEPWWLQWSHGGCNGAMVVAMGLWDEHRQAHAFTLL